MKSEVVSKGLLQAVKDIKLAILQARARAARASNAEALKLYFFVGGYISKKTRSAKWGTGAINALSERLQVELPGLRGFSAQHIRFMRQFYEEWHQVLGLTDKSTTGIRYLPSSENGDEMRYLASSKFRSVSVDEVAAFLSVGFTHHRAIFGKCKSLDERWYYILACAKEHWSVIELERHIAADDYHHVGALPNNFERALPMVQGEEVFVDLLFYHRTLQAMVAIELKMGKFRASYLGQLSLYLSALDKCEKKPNEKPTIGLLLCEEMNKPFVQLAVQDVSKPVGIATYKTLKSIPKPYRALAPVIDGVRKALAEAKGSFK